MTKTVSIIIPFYGQTESDLAIPLSSINNQVGVDFSKLDVHLVNDGGTPIDLSTFKIFANLDLHYHELPENVGAGMARQYAIDHSTGEYLMFVDTDDVLSVTALHLFFSIYKQDNNKQVILAKYYTESKKNQIYNYTPSDLGDLGALYAKWFKRDYLEKIGLRFLPELRLFEDSYFVGTALILSDNNCGINNEPLYIYKFRSNSLSNRDNSEQQKINSINYIVQLRLRLRIIARVKPELFQFNKSLVESYFWQKKYALDDKLVNAEVKKIISEFKSAFHGYTVELDQLAVANSKGGMYAGIQTKNFKNFINRLSSGD